MEQSIEEEHSLCSLLPSAPSSQWLRGGERAERWSRALRRSTASAACCLLPREIGCAGIDSTREGHRFQLAAPSIQRLRGETLAVPGMMPHGRGTTFCLQPDAPLTQWLRGEKLAVPGMMPHGRGTIFCLQPDALLTQWFRGGRTTRAVEQSIEEDSLCSLLPSAQRDRLCRD